MPISALTVPIEMHKNNTILGKNAMHICEPSPHAALTRPVRVYAFQRFNYLNKAIRFYLISLTVLLHKGIST